MANDAKLGDIAARLEALQTQGDRIEGMLLRVIETQQQAPFTDRLAAYTRSTRGELRGGG